MNENIDPEHLSELTPDLVTLHQADAKMRALFKEFKPQGSPAFAFDYVDDDDVRHVASAIVESSLSNSDRMTYHISEAGETYRLEVIHKTSTSGELESRTYVDHKDLETDEYVEADEAQIAALAGILGRLDFAKVRAGMREFVAAGRRSKARHVGNKAVAA
jgi:hypothetical protein